MLTLQSPLFSFQPLLLIITLLSSAQAEIVTDGSLGPAQTLTGPNFVINARLGQQVGNNLFHSFETFNLSDAEQATFQGPAKTERVISRVTGGSPSSISGELALENMPNADLYFINPAGSIFGEKARLQVPG